MRLPVLLVLGLVIGAAAAGCAHFWPKDASAATSADQRFDGKNPVIVRVVGRNKVLTISSGARGVAYSVNGGNGRALLSRGSMEDLRRADPSLYRQLNTGLAAEDAGPLLDASAARD